LRRLLGDRESTIEAEDGSQLPTSHFSSFSSSQQLSLIDNDTQQLGLFDTLENPEE